MPSTEALATEGGRCCPVCAGTAEPRLDLGDYRLLRCVHCGSFASDARVRGAHNSFEPAAYFENADLDRGKWESLFARLGPRHDSPRSVLDVGCGTGAFLQWLARALPGAHREGIEVDPGRAARAAAADPDARIHAADVLAALHEIPGPFDLITLWDVFEHVTAPAALLRALGRKLSAEGVIFVQTIHERSLLPALGRASYRASLGCLRYPARRTHEPHHLVFFTRRGLSCAARGAGLRIRELWFDRLHRGRMDGPALLTGLTSALLRIENAFGRGLFVNLLLERANGGSDGAAGGQ